MNVTKHRLFTKPAKKSRIIIASASPRRQELLRLLGEEFRVIPADIDESVREHVALHRIPAYLADKKAAHVSARYPGDIVLGCDTGVFIDNQMIGKPQSERAAFEILKTLSGRTHRVITGCALYRGEKKRVFSAVTEVEFYPLTDAEIRAYIATGEPMDKAGAYGIQGKGALLIKGIRGDYFNVVGLPVAALKRELAAFAE